jgi:hypothetical protein
MAQLNYHIYGEKIIISLCFIKEWEALELK